MENSTLVVSATKTEITPLLDQSRILTETTSRQGKTLISAEMADIRFQLIITGPGIINTAQALTAVLEHHQPGRIIQTGIAGVFRQTLLKPGDIAIAESEHYIHTGINRGDPSAPPAPLPFNLIEKNPTTKNGIFPVDQTRSAKAADLLKETFRPTRCRVDIGPFITVSAITAGQKEADRLYFLYTPVMEAMEGSGSAHVAALYNIAFMEIRAGSNFVGERDKNRWDIPLATTRASKAVALIIEKGDHP